MGVHLSIKNKITINAAFKTTVSIVIGTSSVIGSVVFYQRHDWGLVAVSVLVSMAAWLRTLTRMPLGLMLFACCGGTVEYEEPTPDGIRRTKLSDLPDSRAGAGIFLGLAVVAAAVALIPGVLHMAARATARTPSQATPIGSSSDRAGHRDVPNPAAVVEE